MQVAGIRRQGGRAGATWRWLAYLREPLRRAHAQTRTARIIADRLYGISNIRTERRIGTTGSAD